MEGRIGRKKEEKAANAGALGSTSKITPDVCAPSRKRALECAAQHSAAGLQPIGAALPTHVPGDPQSKSAHLAAALSINPPRALLDLAVPVSTRAIIEACAATPDAVPVKRAGARTFLNDCAGNLEDNRMERASKLPPDSPSKNIHFPRISAHPVGGAHLRFPG